MNFSFGLDEENGLYEEKKGCTKSKPLDDKINEYKSLDENHHHKNKDSFTLFSCNCTYYDHRICLRDASQFPFYSLLYSSPVSPLVIPTDTP